MTSRASTTSVPLPPGLVPGLDTLGAYHLLRPLGTGGMARVWLAVDARTGRQVAVKRMLPAVAADEELRRAFLDEAELGLRMNHPNIVKTVEVGEIETANGPEPYLVLELLQGRPLIDLLRAAGRRPMDVPLAVAIRNVVDAARALDHAHRLFGADGRPLDVVHRDVSPHNIFACADGTIKLVDFGIAKSSDQSHRTRTGLIKGKLAYLSPEQIRGEGIDSRSDVFALGIVLHEMLVGRPLFKGGNDAETLNRVLTQEIQSPDASRRDVPPGLAAITLRALQRDRERRLPSAGAFADAIEAVAEAEGIHATRDAVRAFENALFPADAEEHAEDEALAKRAYEHLSSSSLRALDPWMTPLVGTPPVAPPSATTRKPLSRPLLFMGALLVTTAAAFVTTRLLHRTHPAPARPVVASAPPVAVSPTPAPIAVTPTPAPVPALPTVVAKADAIVQPEPSALHVVDHKVKRAVLGHGSLRLAAHPWAEVSLDGKALGTTPLRSTEVGEGPHTVVLTNHDLGVVVRRKLVIHAGQESVLVVDLFAEKRK